MFLTRQASFKISLKIVLWIQFQIKRGPGEPLSFAKISELFDYREQLLTGYLKLINDNPTVTGYTSGPVPSLNIDTGL